jgi:hypothetical protein
MKLWKTLAAASSAALLCACSLSPVINHQALDYFNANDIASNQVILQNILRAKDDAPLHFSELASIRGSLTLNSSLSSSIPFGTLDHATQIPRKIFTAGIGVASSPSFDIDSLDTQDFTNGVMLPITPQTAQFFLNDGIDYREVLLLLVSGMQGGDSPELILNAPKSSRVVCYAQQKAQNALPSHYRVLEVDDKSCAGPKPEAEFFAFLGTLNNLPRVYAVSVTQAPRPVGPPFSVDMQKNLRAIASIDPSRYLLRQTSDGQYQLVSARRTNAVVLCGADSNGAHVVGVLTDNIGQPTRVSADACSQPGAGGTDDAAPLTRSNAPQLEIGKSPGTYVFKLRSTLEVIKYVGQIMALQQSITPHCITLDYEGPGATCSGETLFNLQRDSISGSEAVNVAYNGNTWSLPAPQTCFTTPDHHCDHTLETMSVISLLLNQNKSSKDIGKTQAVQVVP